MSNPHHFETLVSALVKHHGVSPIGAGLLAASYMELSQDTRSFSKLLGVAHALVIRDCVALSQSPSLLTVDNRGDRSQRLHFRLTPQGIAMIENSNA